MLYIATSVLSCVCCAWADFSNKFRSVCKAESLIYEYRKYREQFLAWLKLSEEEK